jgi:hypothetical protein
MSGKLSLDKPTAFGKIAISFFFLKLNIVYMNYMLMKHGAEFTGVELPDSFYTKSMVYVTPADDGHSNGDGDGDDGVDGNASAIYKNREIYHYNLVPLHIECSEDIPINQVVRFMLMFADIDNKMCQGGDHFLIEHILNYPDHSMNSTLKYFQTFEEPLNGSSAALVSKLNTPLSFESGEVCVCFTNRIVESTNKLAKNCSTEYFNHLVFDFQQSQLNVEFLNGPNFEEQTGNEPVGPECYEEEVLRDMANFGCTGELIRAKVIIEPLLSSDTSFNHASCQCGSPCFELQQFSNLKQYVHLKSVIVYAKEKDGQMFMWTIYNGIVAL